MKQTPTMRAWEAKLRAEGLAHLDYEDGPDIIVGNRGSGKLDPRYDADSQLRAREDTGALVQRAQEVLRTHRFPSGRDRRIWAMHAEGMGTREISVRLEYYRQGVRASIAATEAAAARRRNRNGSVKALVRQAPAGFLVALFRALA